jgi:hypothetical protein
MVFFMRHFISLRRSALLFYNLSVFLFLLLSLLLIWHNVTLAKPSAQPQIFYQPLPEAPALRVWWKIQLNAHKELEQALHSGVPLDFVLEIEGMERGFFGGKVFKSTLKRSYRLLYHNLAQQYVVIDLAVDRLENFRRLDTALAYLGEEKVFFLPANKLMLHDTKTMPRYRGRLRLRLDNSNLPLLLRGANVFSDDWTLQSPWLAWSWPK